MARGKTGKKPSQTVPSPNVDVITDDDSVVIINARYKGRKTITSGGEVSFDEEGKATVKGSLAKELLTINGFELADKSEGSADGNPADDKNETPTDETPVDATSVDGTSGDGTPVNQD